MQPRALVLHADGTNRDREAAFAFERAGAATDIVHLNQLRRGEKRWTDYHILVLPGGFSYADTLGAGRLLALDLQTYFADEVRAFVASGKPVIGICNGFQALVKSGLLPFYKGAQAPLTGGDATLTFNSHGRFECRWVTLAPRSKKCIWTRGLESAVDCPVAHGEGNFVLRDPLTLETLRRADQIALIYARSDGEPAGGVYPLNPNGSIGDIAGVCDPTGNVLGLMPHPEDHVLAFQHPRWTRGHCGGLGLPLFENGVRYAAQL